MLVLVVWRCRWREWRWLVVWRNYGVCSIDFSLNLRGVFSCWFVKLFIAREEVLWDGIATACHFFVHVRECWIEFYKQLVNLFELLFGGGVGVMIVYRGVRNYHSFRVVVEERIECASGVGVCHCVEGFEVFGVFV